MRQELFLKLIAFTFLVTILVILNNNLIDEKLSLFANLPNPESRLDIGAETTRIAETLAELDEINRKLDLLSDEELEGRDCSSSSASSQTAHFSSEENDYDPNGITSELNTVKYACCYRDVNNPVEGIGRPFPLTPKVANVLDAYMSSKTITHHEKKDHLLPQPVTAFSNNHYSEHMKQIESAYKIFGANPSKNFTAKPIIVYDLGMDPYQIEYVKNNKMLIYRTLDFSKYPEHVELLTTYSWKTIIWAEMLKEFPAIVWFDTSIHFTARDRITVRKMIQKYVINRKTSFLYYVHPAGHSISWATNSDMFGYIPAVIRNMNEASNVTMPQANGVMMWNTQEFKHGVMKWGLLCALTKHCIAPPGAWLAPAKLNKFCPKGRETKKQNHVCHRYDQSLFSILLRNHYQYNDLGYQIQNEEEFLGIPERLG